MTALCSCKNVPREKQKKLVENYIYLSDKSVALTKALAELKFFFGKKTGSAEETLAKITAGKEVSPSSSDGIKELLQEIMGMVSFAEATKEDSFLKLNATVIGIVKSRFNPVLKREFSKASNKAEDKGEKIDVAFLIQFLKDWYTTLNRTFGMSALLPPKAAAPSSSVSPSPSFKGTSKPGLPPKAPATFSKANIAAFDASALGNSQRRPQQNRKFSPQQPRQSSTSQQQEPPLVPSSIQWPQQTQQKYKVCIMCSDAHLLDECPRFSELSVQERKQFLFKQRLCLKCMGRNHLIGNCREKIQCLLCSRFGHNTLMHAAPLTPQTSSPSPSSSSGFVNVAPAGSSLGVQSRLLQLSGTQVEPALTGGNPQDDNQVNVSAVVSNVDCFRPVLAVKVNLPGGRSTSVHALYDTGSNKTLITQDFQRKFNIGTRQQFVTGGAWWPSGYGSCLRFRRSRDRSPSAFPAQM